MYMFPHVDGHVFLVIDFVAALWWLSCGYEAFA